MMTNLEDTPYREGRGSNAAGRCQERPERQVRQQPRGFSSVDGRTGKTNTRCARARSHVALDAESATPSVAPSAAPRMGQTEGEPRMTRMGNCPSVQSAKSVVKSLSAFPTTTGKTRHAQTCQIGQPGRARRSGAGCPRPGLFFPHIITRRPGIFSSERRFA